MKLTGDATITADFSIGLKDPAVSGSVGADGKISLTEFIDSLSNGFSDLAVDPDQDPATADIDLDPTRPNIDDLLNAPSLTGLADIHLDVALDGNLPFVTLGAGTVDLAANLGDVLTKWSDEVSFPDGTVLVREDAKEFSLTGDFRDDFLRGARVTVDTVAPGVDDFATFVSEVSFAGGKTTVKVLEDLPTLAAGFTLANLKIGTPFDPILDLESDLGNLVTFNDVDFNFSAFIDALLLVRDLLVKVGGDDVGNALNTKIPLVDVSLNDLLKFADTFSDALTAAQKNPAGSLQLLDKTISEAFGVAPATDLIVFKLDDFGTPTNFNDDIVKIELNLGAGFNKSLNVRIPDLPLGAL